MPIVVPPPGTEDIDVSKETSVNRNLTHSFIMSDPTQIQLVPYSEVRTASGATSLVAGTAREMQTFRLIPVSSSERPVTAVSEGSGVQRKYDYTLLGEWNSAMAENDRWTDELGQEWVIDSIISYNGYERKGMVMSYGRTPRHG